MHAALHRPRRPQVRRPPARGVATLLVVMALFFLVSMVAAYTSRNLVFEQRTSANQYRATQAFEAAEAGADWALSMLNGGRVDASCAPVEAGGIGSYRQRYLSIDPDRGIVSPVRFNNAGVFTSLASGCLRGAAGWTCSCPTDTLPQLPGGDGTVRPSFRVTFEGTTTPGLFRISSTGCTANDDTCLRLARGDATEAAARVNLTVSLVPGLGSTPPAPVTLRGRLQLGTAMRVINEDAGTAGLTVHTGGAVADGSVTAVTSPGTPGGQSVVQNDASLQAMTADRMFIATFGMSRQAFQRAPATASFTCGGGCGDRLASFVQAHPGRPIWVTDSLTIDSTVALGTVTDPVLLVVAGPVELSSAGASITGVVYSQAQVWGGAGSGSVRGALLGEGDLVGASAPEVRYDPAVLARVRLQQGTVIRLPGGWRDF